MNVASDTIGNETFDTSPGLDTDPSNAIACRLLRHDEDHYSGIAATISGIGGCAHTPLTSDAKRNFGDVTTTKIAHRDEGHLTTGLRANFECQPVEPIHNRGIEDARGVNDYFGGCGSISPRRGGNFYLLCSGKEDSEE